MQTWSVPDDIDFVDFVIIDAPPIYPVITIRPYPDAYPADSIASGLYNKRIDAALTRSAQFKRRFKWWLRHKLFSWGVI